MFRHLNPGLWALLFLILPAWAIAAPPARMGVCHTSNTGELVMLNVSGNALSAHLGHGDVLPATYFADADGDLFGDGSAAVGACEQPAGHVTNDEDCDDTNSSVHPEAEEVCGDGIDNNCDGMTDSEDIDVCGCPCFSTQRVTSALADWASRTWTTSVASCYDAEVPGSHDFVQVVWFGVDNASPVYEYIQGDFRTVREVDRPTWCRSRQVHIVGSTSDYSNERLYITDEEHEACQVVLRGVATDAGITCWP